MSGFTVALRAVHFAAAAALFGELAFLVWTASPGLRTFSEAAAPELRSLRGGTMRVAAACLALALVSGLLWFAVEAAEMSGLPLARALDRDTLGTVIAGTLFGRVSAIRLVLAAALAGALFFGSRGTEDRGAALDWARALLAGTLLASLAWTGHAAAERGVDRAAHLCADVVHLLAAGAWFGSLWPLARLLARARRAADAATPDFAARVTQRFSALGAVSVGCLLLSGTVNAWYTLGGVPAIFGTDYGRLLLAKLVLFAAMLGFAAANRLRWAPRLRTASRNSAPLALRRLGRNALAETFLGLAVLGIVGALGVSVPAKHVQTVWPFPYTVDPSKPWWLAPAHPTTYLRSPVPYTAASIARGAPLYREHCTACHGAYGYGDGPAAAALAVRPPNLTEHLSHHREGDLFWWLQHGIAGTPMPGFGDRIGDDRLWDLINFLRAQADAARAKEMDSGVGEWRPIAAPDFDFQIGARPQESLRESLSQGLVLLVFCAPPAADGRLRALQTAQAELRRAGVRVLAMEVGRAPAPVGARAEDPTIADPDPRVAAAYALFSGTASREPGAVDDIEFLIDREGYLRARWSPGDQPDWSRLPELLQQVETLNREPPHARASEAHVH